MRNETVCGVSSAVMLWSVVLADTVTQVIQVGPVHWPDVATTVAMLVVAVTVSLATFYLCLEELENEGHDSRRDK